MRSLLLISTFFVFAFSCEKNNTSAGKNVEIYLLKSFQLVSGKCQVNPAVSSIHDTAIVSNADILAYSSSSYQYTLSAGAWKKINALVPRTPFAITVDKEVVFFGINMPSYMSSTCDHSITMDPTSVDNTILLRLGYPWAGSGVSIKDERNNSRLLATLLKQGKLK